MKLTSERCNGIKQGYWSAAKKEDLVQKLGAIEKDGNTLLDKVCSEVCRFPVLRDGSRGRCEICPVQKLDKLLR